MKSELFNNYTMEQMIKDMKRLEAEFAEIKTIISEVHTAIVGNPLTKDGGIAMRLFTVEAHLKRFEEQFKEAERRFEQRVMQSDMKLIESEKKQIQYNVWIKIMWICVGGVASMIFAYILQLLKK